MVSRSRIPAAGIRLSLTLLTCGLFIGAGNASGAELTASWLDNSGGLATTRIERRLSADTAFVPLVDVPPGLTAYTDPSVGAGQTYCYRALAYDANGVSPYSDEVCATSASSSPTTTLDVTVSTAGTGTGLVTSNPSGISCDPICAVTFATTSSITLAATPAAGSTFAGWSGGGCAGTSTCTLAGDAPVAVMATFTATTTTTPPSADSTAPVVTLEVPSTFARKSKITVGATASDDVGVVKVDFYINESKLLCSDGTAPYTCSWQIPNAPNKTWTLQATATDAAGNVGVSSRITVVPQ